MSEPDAAERAAALIASAMSADSAISAVIGSCARCGSGARWASATAAAMPHASVTIMLERP